MKSSLKMGAFTDHILCIKPVSSKEYPGPLWMHIIGDGNWAEVPPPPSPNSGSIKLSHFITHYGRLCHMLIESMVSDERISSTFSLQDP